MNFADYWLLILHFFIARVLVGKAMLPAVEVNVSHRQSSYSNHVVITLALLDSESLIIDNEAMHRKKNSCMIKVKLVTLLAFTRARSMTSLWNTLYKKLDISAVARCISSCERTAKQLPSVKCAPYGTETSKNNQERKLVTKSIPPLPQ